ncbi:hypothetical protein SSBR45G_63610 [Bradyrhizobium sp. SSBR45G]|uniref:hypothetical protein n=1 Tax=unclassified Bradyrhizobium TaxID=2631580 RepID=UPI002342B6EF|nr:MULTISPECIES: hypothetical protein [unclassified Bradyrhizobium]GLH81452.1 hypothetical protein SSBR45G_63610 [Bradyrhizobium sp. SSBR45G]GLH88859.1 hypothetical protein SSBR45R_63200 [Bradyrhizobium sp. SSBR45R]
MRKPLALGLASLCCLLGSAAHAERPAFAVVDQPSQDGRCNGDNGKGDLDRSEAACLEQIPDLAQRRDGALKLTFRNGRTRVYRNQDAKCASDDKACVKYQLTGYFPDHDLLLLERGRPEGIDWLLVRADMGDEIGIVAPPHYSPERRWLVSVASRLDGSSLPDGIDIIPAKRDRTLKDWHYRTPEDGKWRYEFDRWDSEDQIVLSAKPLEDTAPPRPVAIHRKKSEWLFK